MDSNHRRRKPTDLQSAPFSHSGTRPSEDSNYASTRKICQGVFVKKPKNFYFDPLGDSSMSSTSFIFQRFLSLVSIIPTSTRSSYS